MQPVPLWIRVAPRVALSRCIGFFERMHVPGPWRRALYGRYCSRFGVNMSEAAEPLEKYQSFNAFFTRALKPGARTIDDAPDAIVSPVDARVAALGPIERGRLIQAKGLDYALDEFVVVPEMAGALLGGTFLTLYLAPGDYHRIHAPCDGAVRWAVHEPGTLWPVNASAAASIRDLFIMNERVVTAFDTSFGTIGIVKVGAFNVGAIRAEFDATLGRGRRRAYRAYPVAPAFKKGAEIARFEMGSTVVLLLPRTLRLEPGLEEGARVELGRAVARAAARL